MSGRRGVFVLLYLIGEINGVFMVWAEKKCSLFIIIILFKKYIQFLDKFCMTFQIEVLNKYLFLTSKPCIYLVNLAEKDYIKKKNKW